MLQKKKADKLDLPKNVDHIFKILIIGGSGSGKTNVLLNLINHKLYNDKIYWYAKGPYEAKYQFLINKMEISALNHCSDPKALLNTQMIWIIFMKILKNVIQIQNAKLLITDKFAIKLLVE